MSTFSYILDAALVLLVLLQIKERRFSISTVIRPVVIVGIAVYEYADAIPTAGNDILLIVILGVVGALLGLAAGAATIMRRGDDGEALVRAGWWAAFFWVLGMGARFAFLVWATHDAATLAHFSAQHSITGASAWTDGVLAMAVFEIILRSAVLLLRRRQIVDGGQATPAILA